MGRKPGEFCIIETNFLLSDPRFLNLSTGAQLFYLKLWAFAVHMRSESFHINSRYFSASCNANEKYVDNMLAEIQEKTNFLLVKNNAITVRGVRKKNSTLRWNKRNTKNKLAPKAGISPELVNGINVTEPNVTKPNATERNKTEQNGTEQNMSAEKKPAEKKIRKVNLLHLLMRYYGEKWKEKHKAEYSFAWGKDTKLLRAKRCAMTDEQFTLEFKARTKAYLAQVETPFIGQHRFADFCRTWNDLAGKGKEKERDYSAWDNFGIDARKNGRSETPGEM